MGLALGLSLAAGLAACSAPEDGDSAAEADAAPRVQDVPVTAAFAAVEGGSGALAYLPEPRAGWMGRIVSASREGGLDVFDADGAAVGRIAGPRLSSLAAAPGFQLRGADLPLVFGVDASTNTVRAYAFVRDSDDLLELPMTPIEVEGGAAAICNYREGAGFMDVVVLGAGARAEIWRVRDDGGDLVNAERQAAITLPDFARACTSETNGDIIVASPRSGLIRMSIDGDVVAQTPAPALDIASADFLGRRLVLASADGYANLNLYDARTLEPFLPVALVDALSTPGVGRPGAVAVTAESFGSTYTGGMVAVTDREDGRIKVIARDTFAREIISAAVQDSEARAD